MVWEMLGSRFANIMMLALPLLPCFGCSAEHGSHVHVEQGDKGDPGGKGDQGDQGEKGSKGDKGDPGDAGADAASCIVFPGESIQDCVDLVAFRGGGRVILRSGQHIVSTFIHIHSDNIEILGEGASTVVRLADGGQSSVLVIAKDPAVVNPDELPQETPIRNVSVTHLRIDANKAGQIGESWTEFSHLNMSGVTIRYGDRVTLRDLIVANAPSAGVLVEKTTTRFLLDNVEVSGSEFDGFSCNKSYRGQIVQSQFTHNILAGITATCDCSDNAFLGNTISFNGVGPVPAPGIYLAEAHRNHFSNNIVDQNTDVALLLTGADCGVTATGASLNSFTTNRLTGSSSCGVFLDTAGNSGPGAGNVGIGTFYNGNAVNGVCAADVNLYNDHAPVVP